MRRLTVPQAVVPSAMAMVVAAGFPDGAEITFNVDVTSGANYVSQSVDGNVLTLDGHGSSFCECDGFWCRRYDGCG